MDKEPLSVETGPTQSGNAAIPIGSSRTWRQILTPIRHALMYVDVVLDPHGIIDCEFDSPVYLYRKFVAEGQC